MRHIMQPFKPGDRLEDHAAPIGEVMQQLQTQLAEYRALKEQLAVGAIDMHGSEGRFNESASTGHSDSNASSTSSSLLQMAPTDPSEHFNVGYGGSHT